jgi:hypothetical protein
LQLSVDHVLPLKAGGPDDDTNKVACCQACNSMTSRMKFPTRTTVEDAFRQKQVRVRERHQAFFGFWRENVAPRYLDQPESQKASLTKA